MSNVRVGLLHSRLRVEEKLLRDSLVAAGLDVELVDDRELTLTLGQPVRRWDVVLERSVSQTRGLAVLRVLELWGVATVNRASVVAACASKLETSALLEAAGVPTPTTIIAFSPEAAVIAAEEFGFPVVVKPVSGSWGRLLARLNDRDAAEGLFEHKGTLGGPEHSVFYLQRHIDKPGRDMRAFVVGDEVICAIYRESDHWVTNTARGARTRNCPIDEGLRDLTLRAARAVGGGVLAVNLLEDGNDLLVSEVNATMEFRNSIEITGVDIPGCVANYILEVARGSRIAVAV